MEGEIRARTPVTVRKAGIDDIRNFILPNSRIEEWNEHECDTEMHYHLDSDGYFIGEVDGQAAASVSVVRHSPQHAILGHVLVAPQHRKKGIMGVLLAHALRVQQAPGMTVALDSVVGVEKLYEKYGFKQAYIVQCFEGLACHQITAEARTNGVAYGDLQHTQAAVDALYAYDKEFSFFDRRNFFENFLRIKQYECIVARNDDGKVVGWVMLRPGDEFYRVQPLYANSKEIALTLLKMVINRIPEGENFSVLMPEVKVAEFEADFAPLCAMRKTWHVIRMYKDGEGIVEDLTRVYAPVDFGTVH